MNDENEFKKLLSITQLSNELSLKISKIRQMVFKREIPYLKIGRLIRFEKQEITNWIENLKKEQ